MCMYIAWRLKVVNMLRARFRKVAAWMVHLCRHGRCGARRRCRRAPALRAPACRADVRIAAPHGASHRRHRRRLGHRRPGSRRCMDRHRQEPARNATASRPAAQIGTIRALAADPRLAAEAIGDVGRSSAPTRSTTTLTVGSRAASRTPIAHPTRNQPAAAMALVRQLLSRDQLTPVAFTTDASADRRTVHIRSAQPGSTSVEAVMRGRIPRGLRIASRWWRQRSLLPDARSSARRAGTGR